MIHLTPCRSITRFIVALSLLGSINLLAGCSLLPNPKGSVQNHQAGELLVRASLKGLHAAAMTESTVTLTLRKDGRDRTQTLEVVDSEVTAHLQNVLPGLWEVILSIADSTQTIIYQAKGNVSVTPGGTASVQLVLKPVPGILEVSVDPASHPELAIAKNGRLYVNPGGYSTMKVIEGGLLKGEKELAPGTYDFSIVLYGETTYAKDRLYESPYTTVTITPGRVTRVVWNPEAGVCTIGGRVDTPPEVPSNVQLIKVAQGLTITWQPVADPEGDLAKYRVYARQDPFAEFDMVYELDASKSGYMYPDEELDKGCRIEVAVTAVDAGGQESQRSVVTSMVY